MVSQILMLNDYALQMLKAHGDTTFHEEHLTLTLTLTEVNPTIVSSLTLQA